MAGGKVGRPKGLPKYGGRQKGTLNKRPYMLSELREAGIDVIKEIMSLMPQCSPDTQLQAWCSLLKYCYPQFKQVELNSEHKEHLMVTTANVAELCKIAREGMIHDIVDAEVGELRPHDPDRIPAT